MPAIPQLPRLGATAAGLRPMGDPFAEPGPALLRSTPIQRSQMGGLSLAAHDLLAGRLPQGLGAQQAGRRWDPEGLGLRPVGGAARGPGPSIQGTGLNPGLLSPRPLRPVVPRPLPVPGPGTLATSPSQTPRSRTSAAGALSGSPGGSGPQPRPPASAALPGGVSGSGLSQGQLDRRAALRRAAIMGAKMQQSRQRRQLSAKLGAKRPLTDKEFVYTHKCAARSPKPLPQVLNPEPLSLITKPEPLSHKP